MLNAPGGKRKKPRSGAGRLIAGPFSTFTVCLLFASCAGDPDPAPVRPPPVSSNNVPVEPVAKPGNGEKKPEEGKHGRGRRHNSKFDKPKAYIGSADEARNPAKIRVARVFTGIPEYLNIREQQLDEDDPQFWSLLSRANKKFYRAIEEVARMGDYDAIIEDDSVPDNEYPDVTHDVIEIIKVMR